jgi:transcriptional regulator with GAF, ATPase, and Fis domain
MYEQLRSPAPPPDPSAAIEGSGIDAFRSVREATAHRVGLLSVAEGAAESVLESMSALWVNITLLDQDRREYWDVVMVGSLPSGEERFPKDRRYPLSKYPKMARRLLADRGYIASGENDEILAEYRAVWSDDARVGSLMGVPIVVMDTIYGEMTLARHRRDAPFSPAEFDVVCELAFTIASRLPALLLQHSSNGEGSVDVGDQSLKRLQHEAQKLITESPEV